MSEPYLGEIRLFPYQRGAPRGWQLCNGALIAISQNEALFTLIGTTYGGDGRTTFGLPDLRGRIPIHQGQGPGQSPYALGSKGGTEQVTLTAAQMPAHTHPVAASREAASSPSPANNLLAATDPDPFYATVDQGGKVFDLAASTINPAGSGLSHENCAPTLTLQYCIATVGIFPSQN